MHNFGNIFIVKLKLSKYFATIMKLNTKKIKDKFKASSKGSKLYIIMAVIVIAAGAFAYIRFFSSDKAEKSTADCSVLTQESTELVRDRKFKEAYDKLNPNKDACLTPLSDEEIKKPDNTAYAYSLIQLNGNFAIATYETGNRDEAVSYAKEGLRIDSALSAEQTARVDQARISDLNIVRINMYKIKEGTYVSYPSESTEPAQPAQPMPKKKETR